MPGCTVVFYESGKLVVQGKQAGAFAEVLSPRRAMEDSGATRFDQAVAKLPDPTISAWLGSDESGKGDYFGPLVVCAVRVERTQLPLLDELGVADCKDLSDQQVRELAPGLKQLTPHSLVRLGPKRYNALYRKIGNLNRLLAWAHARAIENVLEAHPETTVAVVDKFGPEHRIRTALMERGRTLTVVQRTRAEDDPAVAAASILARADFLAALSSLGRRYAIKLPKGAGGPVLSAGHRFVQKTGVEALEDVAKLHFKITEKLGGLL